MSSETECVMLDCMGPNGFFMRRVMPGRPSRELYFPFFKPISILSPDPGGDFGPRPETIVFRLVSYDSDRGVAVYVKVTDGMESARQESRAVAERLERAVAGAKYE